MVIRICGSHALACSKKARTYGVPAVECDTCMAQNGTCTVRRQRHGHEHARSSATRGHIRQPLWQEHIRPL